ncbi:hypothetical protein DPSP01_004034 [Paraphaeosphaeria sporulosa]
MLSGRIQSFFSIIELEFKEPFTERGPPKFLEDTFKECLHHLEQEEKAEWILWGEDLTDPDRVCIMLGRKLPLFQRGADVQAAVPELKAKGMPTAIKPLLPFLAAEPILRHLYSAERNEPMICDITLGQEHHCDVFIVENPSNGSHHQSINLEMMALKRESSSLLPVGFNESWGDMNLVVMGVDGSDETSMMTNPDHDIQVHTFVFLFYWAHPKAMARFKDSYRESFMKHGWHVANDWWRTEVTERFARVENAGARVKHGTFKLLDFEAGSPLIWWIPESWRLQTRPVPESNKSWQLKLLLYLGMKVFRRRPKQRIRYTR